MCYISFKQLLGVKILYWNHFTLLLIPAAAFTVIASDNNASGPNFQPVPISRYLWFFDTSVSKGELKTTSLPCFWFIFFPRLQKKGINLLTATWNHMNVHQVWIFLSNVFIQVPHHEIYHTSYRMENQMVIFVISLVLEAVLIWYDA